MRRRLTWILALALVLVVGGAAALVVTAKPTLDDDRNAVDAAWAPLRTPLAVRYELLEAARSAFVAAAGERSVTRDLAGRLAEWKQALHDGDAGTQAALANDLEGQGTRLRANMLGSPRLAAIGDLTGAIASFDGSVPPPALVRAYNRAVRKYADDRDGSLRKPVARVLGFDARPVLLIGS
jgi:hypothetical protein